MSEKGFVLAHRLRCRSLIATVVIAISLSPFNSFATEPVAGQSTAKDSLANELLEDFVSPVTTDAKYVLLGGALVTGSLLLFESRTNQATQIRFSTDKPLGATSRYGDLAGQMIPNAIYVVGMLADQYFTGSAKAKERARFMFESTAMAGLATTMIKYIAREPRPDGSDRASFPSGHATTIFAFATAVALEHEWYYAVPAYALGVFVSASRVNDNRHYMHDVAAGAAVGASFAFGVWLNMRRRHQIESEQPAGLSSHSLFAPLASSEFFIVPTSGFDGAQLIVPIRF